MDNLDRYENLLKLIRIQLMKYQYAVPDKKYNGETKDANYIIETEWHQYFSVDLHENYFIEDELEFLKALRDDLREELNTVDKLIEDKGKTRKKRNK